jgi:TPR repeat protein
LPGEPAAAERQSSELDALVSRADQLYDKRDFAAALPLYRQAAAQGQAHAMMRVGFCFDLGYGVESDPAAALPWYQKAVAGGDLESMAYLGGLYEKGTVVDRDYGRAMALYRRSAAGGEPAGMNKLGRLYSAGHGVPADPVEALRWYRRAADLGYSWAMNNLANAYISGSGVPKDPRQALEWFRKAADLGNDEAMTALGEAYAHGELSAPRDLTVAAAWFKKAAALDNDKARQLAARLGRPIYDLNGDWEGYYLFQGLPEAIRIVQDSDSITATRLHTLDLSPMNMPFFRGRRVGDSQKADIEIAQYSMLGVLFTALQGKSPLGALGGPSGWTSATLFIADPDHIHLGPASAFERISAPRPDDIYCDFGNPLRVKAKFAYARGKIAQATQHYETAACWYQIGIGQDSAKARSGMGDLLRYGLGVRKNPEWARGWFDKAAASGDPYGAQSIAEMFDRGELAPNPAMSSFWHAQARAMKEQQDKLIAARKRQAEKDRAVMVLLTGAAACDVRQVAENGTRIPGSVSQTLVRNRDLLLESGQIYCGSPIDLSPLVKFNNELKAYEDRTSASDERR